MSFYINCSSGFVESTACENHKWKATFTPDIRRAKSYAQFGDAETQAKKMEACLGKYFAIILGSGCTYLHVSHPSSASQKNNSPKTIRKDAET